MTALINFKLHDLARTQASIAIVFYFAAFCSLIVLPFMIMNWQFHSLTDWLLLVSIRPNGTIRQILMTAALRFGNVSSILILDYTAIIWAVTYGWLVWGQLPEPSVGIGVALVVSAGLLIAYRK